MRILHEAMRQLDVEVEVERPSSSSCAVPKLGTSSQPPISTSFVPFHHNLVCFLLAPGFLDLASRKRRVLNTKNQIRKPFYLKSQIVNPEESHWNSPDDFFVGTDSFGSCRFMAMKRGDARASDEDQNHEAEEAQDPKWS